MADNRFNLIDEPWIPVVGKGKVGLRQIFADNTIVALGGNPVEKIAVFKLLLAIAQSAYTPKDENDWESLGVEGLQKKVAEYLDAHYDCFWLYGEKPFLQMPAIDKAAVKSFGTVEMHVATGNTTVVTEIQTEKTNYSDAEKALLVLKLMGFALGGKQTDNKIVLTKGYMGKSASGKIGSSVGRKGFLHSFFMDSSVVSSVYLNLFSKDVFSQVKMFSEGIGIPPWEKMPSGEDDDVANNLKKTYMGRLIPLNRFVLLERDGLHYSEGIALPSYDEGCVDPSVAVDFSNPKKTQVVWANPEKRPWRQLTSLLSFVDASGKSTFENLQLKNVFYRLRNMEHFAIWSGGVSVSMNSGEYQVKGTDSFVESEIRLSSDIFSDSASFFSKLSGKMSDLDFLASKMVYGAVSRYYSDLKTDGKDIAAKASNLFWQLSEKEFQYIVDVCLEPDTDLYKEKISKIDACIRHFVEQVYNQYCPNQSARQLEAWAKNFPGKVLKRGA
jgi:CRISPR system Cascade subunit CasA